MLLALLTGLIFITLLHVEKLLLKDFNQRLHFLTGEDTVKQKDVVAKLGQNVSLGDVINIFLHDFLNMSLHACMRKQLCLSESSETKPNKT